MKHIRHWLLFACSLNFFAAWGQGAIEVSSWEVIADKFRSPSDTFDKSDSLYKAAHRHWQQQSAEEAVACFKQLLPIYQSQGDTSAEASTHRNLGMLYTDQGNFPTSIDHLRKSLDLYRAVSDTNNIGPTLVDLAGILNRAGRYQETLLQLENSLPVVKRVGDIQLTRSYYGLLAQTYQYLGQAERSMEYFMYYISLDTEIQERISRKIEEKAVQAEQQVFVKKKELAETMKELEKVQELSQEQRSAISKLNAETALKELALSEKEARLENEAWVRRLLTGGVVLSLAVLSLLFVYFRQTKHKNTLLAQKNVSIERQKREIEEQQAKLVQQSSSLEETHRQLAKYNRNVLHSINYARRIQSAMLPEESDFQRLLADSFVYFQPRDIVSGDFYWFTETRHKPTDNQLAFTDKECANQATSKTLVAAMDCTGHGVPGAFMSMIGFNFLNEIEHKGIVQPNEILNTLHLSVRRFLKQDETANKDGMDAAICLIDSRENILEFAGANNPLIYIQEGEVHVVKGDRSAVGGVDTDRNHRFVKHTISIEKETHVYLFSDGYQDQFGGAEGRKFMSKNLRALLLKIHTHPFQTQKQILDDTIKQWMGDAAQIDDILVMGFKVGGQPPVSEQSQ